MYTQIDWFLFLDILSVKKSDFFSIKKIKFNFWTKIFWQSWSRLWSFAIFEWNQDMRWFAKKKSSFYTRRKKCSFKSFEHVFIYSYSPFEKYIFLEVAQLPTSIFFGISASVSPIIFDQTISKPVRRSKKKVFIVAKYVTSLRFSYLQNKNKTSEINGKSTHTKLGNNENFHP